MNLTPQNLTLIAKMAADPVSRRNFLKLHLKFRQSPDYHLINMARCGLNIISHDRLTEHDGYILVNSFIPPVNSRAFDTIANHVPGRGADFFENHTTGARTAPISCYIAATDKCMYRCWHCSAHKFMKDAALGSEFTTAQLKEVVRRLQDLGVGIIGFTGGEPLLRTDLEEVIASVDSRSVSYLFTTGYGLTAERARALKQAGLLGIAVSLDSLNAAAHNAMRRNPRAFAEAIRAIKNAKKAGLYTMTQTVCTRELLGGEIFRLARQMKKLGVDEMRIMEPLPCGSLADHPEAVLTAAEQRRLRRIHELLNTDPRFPKASVFPYFESERQFGCGAGVQHSYVDNKGNFGPCDFLDCTFGNLLEEDPRRIWRRMTRAVDGPHCACLAKHPGARRRLPDFYRLMRGAPRCSGK